MAIIQEYKDKAGKNRIRQIANNGEISDSTHQGYFNIQDARQGKINTSIYYLNHYFSQMDKDQLIELARIGDKARYLLEKIGV